MDIFIKLNNWKKISLFIAISFKLDVFFSFFDQNYSKIRGLSSTSKTNFCDVIIIIKKKFIRIMLPCQLSIIDVILFRRSLDLTPCPKLVLECVIHEKNKTKLLPHKNKDKRKFVHVNSVSPSFVPWHEKKCFTNKYLCHNQCHHCLYWSKTECLVSYCRFKLLQHKRS